MESEPRTFTREEAEILLPEVDQLLAEAQELAQRLADAEREALSRQWQSRTNGKVAHTASGEPPEVTRREVARDLARVLERIQAMGVVVRDVRSGLIDFPSLRDGRIINLCWRRGEPLELRWWHEVDAGFAGRQRLDA